MLTNEIEKSILKQNKLKTNVTEARMSNDPRRIAMTLLYGEWLKAMGVFTSR